VIKEFVIVMLLCLLAGAVVPSESMAGSECRTLLTEKCQACHYLERVCSEVGKKSERRWKATLTRMVERRGVELKADEQKSLLDCLAASDPGIIQECGKLSSSKP